MPCAPLRYAAVDAIMLLCPLILICQHDNDVQIAASRAAMPAAMRTLFCYIDATLLRFRRHAPRHAAASFRV